MIDPPRSEPQTRFHEVDVWKAVAILAVILIHSLRPFFDPNMGAFESWLGVVLRFAVPAFFATSGFLYATTERVEVATTRRRLARILIPYVLASLGAECFWRLLGEGPQLGSVWKDLLLGASFGPYYFVFVITMFVLVTPLLARVPRAALTVLLLVLLSVQFLLETRIIPPISLVWQIRNPFLWSGYFMLGWWARLHRSELNSAIERSGSVWLGVVGLFWLAQAVAAARVSSPTLLGAVTWCCILAALLFGYVFGVVVVGDRVPEGVRMLSEASYAIYLFHSFFLIAAMRWVPMGAGFSPLKVALYWSAGLGGSILLVAGARALLGPRARLLLGA